LVDRPVVYLEVITTGNNIAYRDLQRRTAMSDSTSVNYNFGDNLTYMFKDPRWVTKILIGALLGLVPILNFVTGGYALRTINNIRADTEPPLPEWSGNLGKFFSEGLLLWVMAIIYSIPLWIIGVVSGIPLAVLGSQENAQNLRGILGAASCGVGFIALVYLLLMVFWLQGAIVNFAVKGNFGAAFAFGEVWQIVQTHAGKMVLTVVAVLVASIVVGVVSGVLAFIPCCGWIAAWLISFATAFYILLVMSYTCGHIAKAI
jgi:hypothetical protein